MRGMTTPTRMTPLSIVNADGGAHVVYRQKELLKAAGWVITSGDGLSAYDGTTDVITHEGSGAGGMRNNLAWFRARQPAAVGGLRKEFCIQVVSAAATAGATTVRSKFSPEDGFVTGSPSATQVPAAADEQILQGDVGTDASPTGVAGWIPTNNSYAMGIADAAAPYGFAFWFFENGATDNDFMNGCRWILDPVTAPHHDGEDPDLYVVHLTQGGSGNDPWFINGISSTTFSASYGSPGWALMQGGAWDEVALQAYRALAGSLHATDGTGVPVADAWTGKATLLPAIYSNAEGMKGVSTLLHWVLSEVISNGNNLCFTVDGETNAYVKRQAIALPWGGDAPGDFTTVDATVISMGGDSLGTPTISDPDPVPGDFTTDREDARLTAISFLHTKGVADSDAIPVVYIQLGSDIYIAYGPNCDGGAEGFAPMFKDRSTVVDNGNGTYNFSLLPGGGWWGNPDITSGDYFIAEVV